jgi:hypothetical protein
LVLKLQLADKASDDKIEVEMCTFEENMKVWKWTMLNNVKDNIKFVKIQLLRFPFVMLSFPLLFFLFIFFCLLFLFYYVACTLLISIPFASPFHFSSKYPFAQASQAYRYYFESELGASCCDYLICGYVRKWHFLVPLIET